MYIGHHFGGFRVPSYSFSCGWQCRGIGRTENQHQHQAHRGKVLAWYQQHQRLSDLNLSGGTSQSAAKQYGLTRSDSSVGSITSKRERKKRAQQPSAPGKSSESCTKVPRALSGAAASEPGERLLCCSPACTHRCGRRSPNPWT